MGILITLFPPTPNTFHDIFKMTTMITSFTLIRKYVFLNIDSFDIRLFILFYIILIMIWSIFLISPCRLTFLKFLHSRMCRNTVGPNSFLVEESLSSFMEVG